MTVALKGVALHYRQCGGEAMRDLLSGLVIDHLDDPDSDTGTVTTIVVRAPRDGG
jgi:hypothetical protein